MRFPPKVTQGRKIRDLLLLSKLMHPRHPGTLLVWLADFAAKWCHWHWSMREIMMKSMINGLKWVVFQHTGSLISSMWSIVKCLKWSSPTSQLHRSMLQQNMPWCWAHEVCSTRSMHSVLVILARCPVGIAKEWLADWEINIMLMVDKHFCPSGPPAVSKFFDAAHVFSMGFTTCFGTPNRT